MRGGTKVVIGFGSIWGLYAFGIVVVTSFTIGANDTFPEILAVVLYGFTIVPACIAAIWRRRAAAIWLFVLSGITAFGFAYQQIIQPNLAPLRLRDMAIQIIISAIPAVIGFLLLRTSRDENISPSETRVIVE
jgi:hypothetical protein